MAVRKTIICAIWFSMALNPVVAQEEIPATITFDGSADGNGSDAIYPAVYTGPVAFSHAKHVTSYDAGCGDCHHDDSLDPIESYDPEETYTCIDCHDEDGLVSGTIAENATSEVDLIAYRANVLHQTCIGCHKRTNNNKHVVRAPEACIACHAGRPSGWILE